MPPNQKEKVGSAHPTDLANLGIEAPKQSLGTRGIIFLIENRKPKTENGL